MGFTLLYAHSLGDLTLLTFTGIEAGWLCLCSAPKNKLMEACHHTKLNLENLFFFLAEVLSPAWDGISHNVGAGAAFHSCLLGALDPEGSVDRNRIFHKRN